MTEQAFNAINANFQAFSEVFAAALARSIERTAGSSCTVSNVSSVQPPESEADSVWVMLTLTGALVGKLALEVSASDAAQLEALMLGSEPGNGPVDQEVVFEALSEGAREFALSGATKYGEFQAAAVRDVKPSFDALNRCIELSISETATFSIILHGSAELATSIVVARGIERPDRDAGSAVKSPAAARDATNLDLVMDIELNVTLRFGQRQLTLREVMELTSGSVIELDRQVEEPVDLLLDGKVIARGEAVVIDGYYGLRVSEVPQPFVPPLPRN